MRLKRSSSHFQLETFVHVYVKYAAGASRRVDDSRKSLRATLTYPPRVAARAALGGLLLLLADAVSSTFSPMTFQRSADEEKENGGPTVIISRRDTRTGVIAICHRLPPACAWSACLSACLPACRRCHGETNAQGVRGIDKTKNPLPSPPASSLSPSPPCYNQRQLIS